MLYSVAHERLHVQMMFSNLGHIDTVQPLVRHGACVKERDFQGNTLLHLAAEMAQMEVVRSLLERWPEGKEALNNYKRTPLSMFEKPSRRQLQLSDEENQEIIALLGGPHFEANNYGRQELLFFGKRGD
jgi:ankyrin repeat protein